MAASGLSNRAEAQPSSPPVVAAPPTVAGYYEGDFVKFDVSATDPDGDHVALSASGAVFTFPINPATFNDNDSTAAPFTGTFRWTPDSTQAGTYSVEFTGDDGLGGIDTVRTNVVICDPVPRSPNMVRGYFASELGKNTVLLVWNGARSESGNPCWMGYRVRRTLLGISPAPFEVVGQHKSKDTVTSVCFSTRGSCDLSQFVFYGTGIFFKGFKNNEVSPGKYFLDYPPGQPVDNCDSCRLFVDEANLGGFTSQYAVTSIDTVRLVQSDFTESAIDPAEIVTVQPSAPPAANLEQVAVVPNPFRGSAEWDTGGGHEVHFIHLVADATVRVFTANGYLVRELKQDPGANSGGVTGDLAWDLKNGEGKDVVSGIYIFQIETPGGLKKTGHFVVIR